MTNSISQKTKSADSIIKAAQKAHKKGPPPVHLWHPPFCGDLDMRIARDGTWFYQGTPIGRMALVKLFASILRRDGDKYFLVTPVEKVGIEVDDAPFVAVDFELTHINDTQAIRFYTNVEDSVIAGRNNPIRIEYDEKTGEPSPYVLIRSNLEALIDRKSFYRLVDIGVRRVHKGIDWFGILSNEVFFPLMAVKDLYKE